MPSSIADFRARLYEDLTLPSGLTARIRKVQVLDFLGLGELPIPVAPMPDGAASSPQDLALLRRYTERALVCGVVEPPLTDELDDGGRPARRPDRLHVSELLTADYQALATAILRWSGLLAEDATNVAAFSPDAERSAGADAGGPIPRTPLGDPQADAGGVLLLPTSDLATSDERAEPQAVPTA